MNKGLYILTLISAIMLALGFCLPFVFAFLLGGYNWSPAIWNFLQMGGLGGLVVFGLAYRFTKPRAEKKSNA